MLVIPKLDSSGKLSEGVHWITWEEMVSAFGFTPRRTRLITGLNEALQLLKAAGCQSVYIDGSFVTGKPEPGDIDVCWAVQGVNALKLDRFFLNFTNSRARQKRRFLSEFFPAEFPEGLTGRTFLEFFQIDKETGNPKGILALDLRGWQT